MSARSWYAGLGSPRVVTVWKMPVVLLHGVCAWGGDLGPRRGPSRRVLHAAAASVDQPGGRVPEARRDGRAEVVVVALVKDVGVQVGAQVL